MTHSTSPVRDERDNSRFVVSEEGGLAQLQYRVRADRLVLVHTEVPEALGGRGIGGNLVRAAVARAAAEGLTVVPACEFAADWLRGHPDAAADITIDWNVN